MARGDNYQSFYPTKNLTLLDAKVGQPNGWVSKDCLLYTSDAADE